MSRVVAIAALSAWLLGVAGCGSGSSSPSGSTASTVPVSPTPIPSHSADPFAAARIDIACDEVNIALHDLRANGHGAQSALRGASGGFRKVHDSPQVAAFVATLESGPTVSDLASIVATCESDLGYKP